MIKIEDPVIGQKIIEKQVITLRGKLTSAIPYSREYRRHQPVEQATKSIIRNASEINNST